MLIDKFNRIHNYLRISLTDHCNLRCNYCMPEEHYDFAPSESLMQYDEIMHITKTFVSLGVNKIRLTGGEPLVRKDAKDIILGLSKMPVELAITTNATRIHEFEDVFNEAKLSNINISLDTLNKKKFMYLTRRDQFELVYNNINTFLSKGYNIKVNMVVMKGVNDNEILDFIEWTKDIPLEVRFIEFMPFTGNQWDNNKLFTYQEILNLIKSKHEFQSLASHKNDTSKGFKIEGYKGSFAIISTMSMPFCSGCNRIRLTADGKLKNCLFSKNETDLLTTLRNGGDIVPLIFENIKAKKKELGGQFNTDHDHLNPKKIENRSMISIGG